MSGSHVIAWDAPMRTSNGTLVLARATLPVISVAADTVSRFYLPLAHTMAGKHGHPNVDGGADLRINVRRR